MPSDRTTPQKNQRGIFWVFLLFVIVAAGGAAFLYYQSGWRVPAAAKNLKSPIPANDETIGAGMMIYMQRCQSCHGEKGDGKGEKAAQLSIMPAEFTDASSMKRLTDGELFWQITHGRLPMPSFQDSLTEEERWQVIAYIRTFARKPGTRAQGAH